MKDTISIRMTKEAWKRDRFATISFISFVAISVAMISLTMLLFCNLTGAIDNLMEVTKTPDYLQMHTGEIDTEALEQFALGRPEVVAFQVTDFLNLDNSILTLGEQSLLDSTQDNGISVQGKRFDFMMDLKNELPQVLPGQVYVPVCYESLYHVKIGDVMGIGSEKLIVAGFIRDSQMNSMMASSKRFLVCDEDYEKLRKLGSEEYLIEFLFKENVDSNAFKTAYENAKLPMNGPTITGPLIQIMNTLSDGIIILIILLISLLALLISLVCIRFMLVTRIVDEAGEVGIMRAIGLSQKEIRTIFLRRYSWLVFAGALLGEGIALLLFDPLSAQMQKLYGVSPGMGSSVVVSVLSAAGIGGAIIIFVLRTLRRLNEMTALQALAGKIEEGKKNSSKLCMTLVTAIAVFLMLVPSNLYHTLSAPEFVTYMGIGNAQIRMDLREGRESRKDFGKIGKLLSEDEDVKEYALYQTCSTPVRLKDGTTMNMLMEQGNHTCFPVRYSKGCAPAREGEVALSYLLSKELGLDFGDEIWVKTAGEYKKCHISGVYADITNGGKTAKLFTKQLRATDSVLWRIAYVTLKENADETEFIQKYTAEKAQVADITSRIRGTYGPTLMQIQRVSVLVKMMASVIMIFVIMLFVRMMIAGQRIRISVKKAIGFSTSDIRKSFLISCVPYVLAGVMLGTIGGFTLGEGICKMALQSLGAEGFQFVFHLWSVTANMLLGGFVAILAVYLGSQEINRIKAVECCRGRE